MSGTWLQENYYGAGLQRAADLGAHPTTQQLLHVARSHAAVAEARKACTSWIVVTSAYRKPAPTVMPPHSHAPIGAGCWLAFVATGEDQAKTPGWTPVPLTLFEEFERNTNAVKVMAPLLFEPKTNVFYLDFSLTRARCMSLPHIIRAAELEKSSSSKGAPLSAKAPHLFASAIPSWSGRSSVPVQLDMTRAWIKKRADAKAAEQLASLEAAMAADAGPRFNSSVVEKRLIPDTLWMVWLGHGDGVAQALARSWFDEVAHRCAYEKASFAWIASKLPSDHPTLPPLRKLFTNAVYIYGPDQRCQCSATTVPAEAPPTCAASEGSNATGSKRKHRSRGRLRRRNQ